MKTNHWVHETGFHRKKYLHANKVHFVCSHMFVYNLYIYEILEQCQHQAHLKYYSRSIYASKISSIKYYNRWKTDQKDYIFFPCKPCSSMVLLSAQELSAAKLKYFSKIFPRTHIDIMQDMICPLRYNGFKSQETIYPWPYLSCHGNCCLRSAI